jgi:hypothetical protein
MSRAAETEKVKAVLCTRYGPPEVLRVEDVTMPVPGKNNHWSDQQAGVREFARVLMPGGHLMLVDLFSLWLIPTLNRPPANARNQQLLRVAHVQQI